MAQLGRMSVLDGYVTAPRRRVGVPLSELWGEGPGGHRGLRLCDMEGTFLVQHLRDAVARTPLSVHESRQARVLVGLVECELDGPAPNKLVVIEWLNRLSQIVRSSGAVTSPDTAVARQITVMVGWLEIVSEPRSQA